MIQNVLIIKNGIALVDRSFGQCYSLGQDSHLLASFFSILQNLSLEFIGSSIKSLNISNKKFFFYKDHIDSTIFYVIVSDIEDDSDEMKFKIRQIASLFREKYSNYLKDFDGNITYFNTFVDLLIEMKLAQKCEDHSCKECSVIKNIRRNKKKLISNLNLIY